MTKPPFGFKVNAPEFEGIIAWLNSKPLSMAEMRGKVVLIDFWTYTCINCLRTIPYLNKWKKKYGKDGLVIIGVHTPEFEFEKSVQNVKKAVKDLKIAYPVALDSDAGTWKAYDNECWPAKFLISKEGFVAYVHFGEGNYRETELRIQEALGLKKKVEKEEPLAYLFDQSPETYAGHGRNMGLGSGMACDEKGCDVYIDPGKHEMNMIYPHGPWVQQREYLELEKTPGQLSYRFNAREVNVVIAPLKKKAKADVYIDGKKKGKLTIDHADRYNVFSNKKYKNAELSIVFHDPVRVYAFTFG